MQFEDHLASLTSTLDGSRSDLDGAVKNLSDAVGDVQRFVSGSRDATAEQIQRLADVTQNLADHRMDLEQVLHVSPNALVNTYNMVDPRTGGSAGEFLLRNLANPTHFFCTMIGALGNVTSAETAKLCAQTLGPGLDRLNVNYIPFPINPFQIGVPPSQDLIYSEARLQPGGEGPKPPVPGQPPAVSAYTGAPGDTPNAVPPNPPGPAPSATDASPAPAPTSDSPGPFPAERPSP